MAKTQATYTTHSMRCQPAGKGPRPALPAMNDVESAGTGSPGVGGHGSYKTTTMMSTTQRKVPKFAL